MNPATVAATLRKAVDDDPLWIDAEGSSMGPRVGGRVLVVAGDEPRRGEVWAFCVAGGSVVVHRCIGRSAAAWRFRGDGRADADPPVTRALLVGRATHFEDRSGATRSFGGAQRMRGAIRRQYLTARRTAGRALRAAGLRGATDVR